MSDGLESYRWDILEMLSGIQTTWDAYPGRIKIDKHRNDLIPDKTTSIHCEPYRTGPSTKDFECIVVDKMIS